MKIDEKALKAYRRAWCEWAKILPVERFLSRDEYALEAYEADKASEQPYAGSDIGEGPAVKAASTGTHQPVGCASPMELLKLLGYINAMIGYCQSLRVGTVITDEYMKRMSDHYIPNVQQACLLIASLVDKAQSPKPELAQPVGCREAYIEWYFNEYKIMPPFDADIDSDVGFVETRLKAFQGGWNARATTRESSQSVRKPNRFENGKYADLDLVQKVADVICKPITANNPAFRGGGLLDATNAAIDIMEAYFSQRSPTRESGDPK